MGDLAYKIRPRHGWEDLVLPQEKMAVLREMTAMVRGRPKVLDEWGVIAKLASSRAVTALFAGEPGTGKTIAAEVIAGDLGLDLYKIDLSSLVDKYIGETEKNLERIFTEAESANAILFFDEADAIFGKRTGVKDAHDRYANVGVSYLLQRMETFDGITILATNLRANLDDAFTRRLHFMVDFPFPGRRATAAHLAGALPTRCAACSRRGPAVAGAAFQAGRRQHPQHHRQCGLSGGRGGGGGGYEPSVAQCVARVAKDGAPVGWRCGGVWSPRRRGESSARRRPGRRGPGQGAPLPGSSWQFDRAWKLMVKMASGEWRLLASLFSLLSVPQAWRLTLDYFPVVQGWISRFVDR